MLEDLNNELNETVAEFNSLLKASKQAELTRTTKIMDVYEKLQINMELSYLTSYVLDLLILIKDNLRTERDQFPHKRVTCDLRIKEANEYIAYYKDFNFTFNSRSRIRSDELKFLENHTIDKVDDTLDDQTDEL